MSEEIKHIVYTAADIQKYLSGGMPAPEMYAIEKAALDDPFLSEAIEGYGAMEQRDWNKELSALQQNVSSADSAPIISINKKSFIKWWRAAAAVIVITSSIAITYFFNTNKIANKNTETEITVRDNAAPLRNDSSLSIIENKSSAPAAVATNDKAKKKELPGEDTPGTNLLATVKTKKVKKDISTEQLSANAVDEDTKDNAAITNATIDTPNNDETSATKQTAVAPKQIADAMLDKSSTAQSALNKNLAKEENTNLNEVVITQNKKIAQKKRPGDNYESQSEAAPIIGWMEYNKYLSKNIIMPPEAQQQNIQGEVLLIVKIGSNGEILKVKVNKPLCRECDAEAIRLVKEGPKWQVKNNKVAKVKVLVKF